MFFKPKYAAKATENGLNEKPFFISSFFLHHKYLILSLVSQVILSPSDNETYLIFEEVHRLLIQLKGN